MKHWQALMIILALSFLPGIIGAVFLVDDFGGFYAGVEKPAFAPPDWVFVPVWVLLYFLVGLAVYTMWKDGVDKRENKAAYFIFILHLILNGLWSFLFFNQQWLLLAIEMPILLIVAGLMFFFFRRVTKKTSKFLIPYLLWVLFASALNGFTWFLNK